MASRSGRYLVVALRDGRWVRYRFKKHSEARRYSGYLWSQSVPNKVVDDGPSPSRP